MKRFIIETGKLVLSLAAVSLAIVMSTYHSNQDRIAETQRLESKIDALAEAQGLEFVGGEK